MDNFYDFIKTEGFVQELIHIDKTHPFISYLRGIMLDTIDLNSFDGYYTETKAYFYLKYPHKLGNIIFNGWKMYLNNENIDITIYGKSCGKFYDSNEFETEKKYFYKSILDIVSDKLVDSC